MAMSEAHKEALALGRVEARALKAYLSAIEGRKPGRPVTPESLKKRIAALTEKIDAATDPLRIVEYRQVRLDAEKALEQAQSVAAIDDLEDGFVKHAASYSSRKGITYAAWRESGVPAAVLQRAGIGRSA